MVPFCLLRACDSYHPLGCMHAHRLNSRERLVLNSLGCYHSVSRPPPPVLDHIKLHCIASHHIVSHHIVLELLPCYLHLQMHLHLLHTYLNLHRLGHLSCILIIFIIVTNDPHTLTHIRRKIHPSHIGNPRPLPLCTQLADM